MEDNVLSTEDIQPPVLPSTQCAVESAPILISGLNTRSSEYVAEVTSGNRHKRTKVIIPEGNL